MNTKSISGAVLLILALQTTHVAYAQGGNTVYVTQFRDLRAQLNTLAARAESLVAERGSFAAGGTVAVERIEQMQRLRDASLVLLRLVNRLQEDAQGSNLEGLRSGRDSDKTLLLVEVGASALQLRLSALNAFVETGDLSFMAAARNSDSIAASLENVM